MSQNNSYDESNNECNSNTQLNFDNLNKNITTFNIPMGSAGNLVGIFPIILSELETNIFCEIKFKYPIKCLDTIENLVIIKNCVFIDKNSKLLIEGVVQKNINVSFFDTKPNKIKSLKIPFKTIVDINYFIKPKYDTQYKNLASTSSTCESYISVGEKLFWSHEYTKLKEECFKITSDNKNYPDEYINKLILTLGINILQNQKVFIPEPQDSATVIAESIGCKGDNSLNEITHVEVGVNKKSKLIARIIKG